MLLITKIITSYIILSKSKAKAKANTNTNTHPKYTLSKGLYLRHPYLNNIQHVHVFKNSLV